MRAWISVHNPRTIRRLQLEAEIYSLSRAAARDHQSLPTFRKGMLANDLHEVGMHQRWDECEKTTTLSHIRTSSLVRARHDMWFS